MQGKGKRVVEVKREKKPTGGKHAGPPRTRSGKTYPGGRKLRRAMKNLSARVAAHNTIKDAASYTKPGSMK